MLSHSLMLYNTTGTITLISSIDPKIPQDCHLFFTPISQINIPLHLNVKSRLLTSSFTAFPIFVHNLLCNNLT